MQNYHRKKIAKTELPSVSPSSERMRRCQRWKCDICTMLIRPLYNYLAKLLDIKFMCLNVECGPHQTLYCRLRGHRESSFLECHE